MTSKASDPGSVRRLPGFRTASAEHLRLELRRRVETVRRRVAGERRSPAWRVRRLVLVAVDAACWAVGIAIAVVLRVEFDLSDISEHGFLMIVEAAWVLQVVIGGALGLYRGRHCIGTLENAVEVGATCGLVSVVLFGVNLLPGEQWVPRSAPLIAGLVVTALIVGLRTVVRVRRERGTRPDLDRAERVVIFGAGPEGQRLVRSMLSEPDGGYLPVAMLDDDPDVRLRRVLGVAVRGTRTDVASIAEATGAHVLVIADRALDASAVRELALAASVAGLSVRVLPPLTEQLRTWSRISDLKDLDISDLLGRRPVDIDLAAVGQFLGGRRVLVTGAGGSIGSELCRQLHTFGVSELLMLDRDESALHATQLSIYGTALLDTPDVILADIRDAPTLAGLFTEHRPDIVFHAAALKHLPLLEQYPEEAWATNVVGTLNVLEAVRLAGVERFVNISTDKAADPVSVLGRSKRVGELVVADAADRSAGTFVSVRFGNVLGSRGSVLTTFAEQIAGGVPVTVTDPEVTRFFMTIPEAVQLVIYAAAIGSSGEVLVLDMGEPVRIADVARQLMAIAGRPSEIVFTGLRPGEKLHEELIGRTETDRRPIHPSISHIDVPTLDPRRATTHAASVGAAVALDDLTAVPAVDTAPTAPTAPPERLPRQRPGRPLQGSTPGPVPTGRGIGSTS